MDTGVKSPSVIADDEINLSELISDIWKKKFFILIAALFTGVLATYYAFTLPNIYKSDVVLAASTDSSGLKIGSQLGGLAALAGVNIGVGNSDKATLAVEILKSKEFLGNFIEKHNLYVPLMAANGWDMPTNELKYNEELFDFDKNEWIRPATPPFKSKPSALEATSAFKKFMSVSRDKTTGLVSLSMQHYSPYLAKEWVELLVKEINNEMKRRELDVARASIKYLNSQINNTNVSEIKAMLFSLIEEQTKTVMLANVRDEYVFETVDRAYVPELKDSPKRIMILLGGIVFGGFLAVFIIMFLHVLKRK